MSDNCLLSLVVSPAAADSITDWLLAQDTVSGFSSHAIAGHGSSEHSMSLAEQVAGKRGQIMFQLHMRCDDARTLVQRLKQDFSGSGMHYWLLPVIESGHLA